MARTDSERAASAQHWEERAERSKRLRELTDEFFKAQDRLARRREVFERKVAALREALDKDSTEAHHDAAVAVSGMLDTGEPPREVAALLGISSAELKRIKALADQPAADDLAEQQATPGPAEVAPSGADDGGQH